MKKILMTAIFITSAMTAQAGETFDATAVWTGTSTTKPYVIGEGHVVLHASSDYATSEFADPANPMSGTTGGCFGAVEIKSGKASGSGNCVYSDADGDMTTTSWVAIGLTENGALDGTWVSTGGSGKFAGLSGGGSFLFKSDNKTGTFRTEIGGAIRLP